MALGLGEAAALGVLRVRISPAASQWRVAIFPALIAAASEHGLYSNLITSGTLGGEREIEAFAAAGLKHVQLSFQDFAPANYRRPHRRPGWGTRQKDQVRRRRADRELAARTLNMVVHRQNLGGVSEMIDMALALGARRVEVAHVQYYAWALESRGALLPSRAQLDEATRIVEAARETLKGVLAIDYVVPDYYGVRPKSCMNGWGRQFLNVSPSGKAMPCHAAETLPGIAFPSVRESTLADIWYRSDAFDNSAAPTGWPSPAGAASGARSTGVAAAARPSCWAARRAVPIQGEVCALSPDHGVVEAARQEAERAPGSIRLSPLQPGSRPLQAGEVAL